MRRWPRRRDRRTSLRDGARRSVALVVSVMALTALVTIGTTRAVVDAFRDSALSVDQDSIAAQHLKEEVVSHAMLVTHTNGSVPRQQLAMLEQAIRDDFAHAIGSQGSADARSLVQAALAEWEALVHAARGATDDQARDDAVTEHVPRAISLLDEAEAAGRESFHVNLDGAERSERTAIVALVVLELVTILLFVRLARRTSSRVLRPLGVLRDSANRLAAGDLDHRVTVDHRDEIGELAASFNAMADSIAANQRALAREASTDPLSGLANRAAFATRLNTIVSGPERRAGSRAVLFVDLDDFKEVNDRLGHGAGDELLCEVARRLLAAVRPGDLVARLGGDEFALLLDELESPDLAAAVAERVVRVLGEPVELGGDTVQVGASVGVVELTPGSTATQLLRQADIAMYAAKSRGKNRVEHFDAGLDQASMRRLCLRADVRSALDRGEVDVRYEPVVDLVTHRIAGLEVAPHWTHPDWGALDAAELVELAGETGVIVRLGTWVLTEGARHVSEWRQRHERPDMWLSLDVSHRQLESSDFAGGVLRALTAAGLPAECLVLELPESLLAHPGDTCAATIAALRQAGVRLALDGLGTGHSSVGTLRQQHLDMIKIDPSFTADAHANSDGDGLLTAIVSLTQHLGIEPVPEGIDDPEQLDRLRAMGCRIGQGPLLCVGLDAAAMERLLSLGEEAFRQPLRDH
jgi:diguanylate cyclase (GGDEF)-like protein